MRKVILSACILRMGTNLSAIFIKSDTLFALVFLFGVCIFEVVALYTWERKEEDKAGFASLFFNFSLGAAVYGLFKLTFANPHVYSGAEYIALLVGFIYMITKYVYHKLRKGSH